MKFQKGHKCWLGKHHTEETKQRMSWKNKKAETWI